MFRDNEGKPVTCIKAKFREPTKPGKLHLAEHRGVSAMGQSKQWTEVPRLWGRAVL